MRAMIHQTRPSGPQQPVRPAGRLRATGRPGDQNDRTITRLTALWPVAPRSDRTGGEKLVRFACPRIGGMSAQTPTHILGPPPVALRPGGLK